MKMFEDPSDCCGCTACVNICSHNAMTMIPDELGFLYPQIDENLCIQCNKCKKVCVFQNGYTNDLNLDIPLAYAVRHKDMKEIETSRSGAMFIALTDYILDAGGVVYGAGYTEGFRVIHKRAETKEERNEFKGSKYVQSELGDIFLQVKSDLKNGLKVLFSGTPCQTAGLNGFLGKIDKQNLFLIDIICHGVPSPYIWKDYLNYTERINKNKIIKVNFRDKSELGWKAHKESFVFENNQKVFSSTFTDLFKKSSMLRTACSHCRYSNIKRPSDITIGDYWGWEKTDKLFNADDKGCSLVFCNTEKGIDIFLSVQDQIDSIPTSIDKCMQPNLQQPTIPSKYSTSFRKDYDTKGFEFIIHRYGERGTIYRWRRIKQQIKYKIKKIIGK